MANVDVDQVSETFNAFDRIVTDVGEVTCGVNRKINIGNFENIDVFCALKLSANLEGIIDKEELKEVISAVVAETMEMMARETNQRYKLIKELL